MLWFVETHQSIIAQIYLKIRRTIINILSQVAFRNLDLNVFHTVLATLCAIICSIARGGAEKHGCLIFHIARGWSGFRLPISVSLLYVSGRAAGEIRLAATSWYSDDQAYTHSETQTNWAETQYKTSATSAMDPSDRLSCLLAVRGTSTDPLILHFALH